MVTRSSLVWVMTGIAAGIAGGWLWNRERNVEVASAPPTQSVAETIRSPFTQRREERATYLTEQESALPQSAAAPARPTGSASSEFAHRQALYATAGEADRTQLDAMIADAKALPDGSKRRNTLEILLLRYAELDVDGALRYAMETDRETAAHLVAKLSAVVPDRAWEHSIRTREPSERFAYLNAVVSSWAVQEPQRAFAKVAELPADWQRRELLERAAAEIAGRDPRLAIELVGTMEPTTAASLLDLVASVWAENDPAAAGRWVESNPRAKQGRLAYRVADAYVAQKPTEALQWALRLSTTPRRFLWSYMLGQMAAYDPYEALQLAQDAEGPAQHAQAMGNILGSIARTNPTLAMSHLMKLPGGEQRSEILSQIANSVAATTPDAALSWLNEIDDKRMQLQAASMLGYALSRRDVEAAAQLLDRVPKETRASWIQQVAMAYADADFEKGRQWVRRHASESAEITGQFAQAVASRDPEQALQMVGEVVDDKERDRLLAGMLPPLAEHAPETAARWAERVTNDAAREQAVAVVAGTWAQYDLSAARKWVLALDAGPARDQGLSTLVMRSGAAVDDMLPIISEIQTPERRMHAVLMTAMRLSQSDPDSTRTLLRRYPLDPQRQRQLDEYMQRRNKGQ
jgi:hypothetical protein